MAQNSIEEFIEQIMTLMRSHCANYELLFKWLDMMKASPSNKRLLQYLALLKHKLDQLPNKTIPLFQQLAADATLDCQFQFTHRMNFIMFEVAHGPPCEKLLEKNLDLVKDMYSELEAQCVNALFIVRDVAELKFNYEHADETFPKSIEELAERYGYYFGTFEEMTP
ncbi:hypothetical protein CJU89_6012 [Yarrowia sp. B02]|nr:hypothetical protein CJU89_6012 [Yarrowia sp. B02]